MMIIVLQSQHESKGNRNISGKKLLLHHPKLWYLFIQLLIPAIALLFLSLMFSAVVGPSESSCTHMHAPFRDGITLHFCGTTPIGLLGHLLLPQQILPHTPRQLLRQHIAACSPQGWGRHGGQEVVGISELYRRCGYICQLQGAVPAMTLGLWVLNMTVQTRWWWAYSLYRLLSCYFCICNLVTHFLSHPQPNDSKATFSIQSTITQYPNWLI